MNPIEKMLMRNAKRIVIQLAPNPSVFCVLFAAKPEESTYTPLAQLANSCRFTVDALGNAGGLAYQVQKINAISRDEVIKALIESWSEFEVTIEQYSPEAKGYIEIDFAGVFR